MYFKKTCLFITMLVSTIIRNTVLWRVQLIKLPLNVLNVLAGFFIFGGLLTWIVFITQPTTTLIQKGVYGIKTVGEVIRKQNVCARKSINKGLHRWQSSSSKTNIWSGSALWSRPTTVCSLSNVIRVHTVSNLFQNFVTKKPDSQ
jgi:hypothetical protein